MKLAGITCAMALTASAAAAQEITFNVIDTGPVITAFYENASVVKSIDTASNPAPQDYIAAARAEYRALLTALYARGNYGGTVSVLVDGREASDLSPLALPDRIDNIVITINPGKRYSFGTASVEPLAPGTALPEGFAPARTANADEIRAATRSAISAWRDIGYAKAAVTDQQIIARHTDQQLDATVTLNPGQRLTFGALEVSGNKAVRTSAITRIAGLPTGEVFSPAEIDKAARRLRETGAFDSVALAEPDVIGADNTLPIEAQIAESLPRRIGFGLELSSVEGLKVSSYWLHRNILGGAERLRFDGEVAGIGGGTGGTDYALGVGLGVPAIYGPDTDFSFAATISRDDEPDYLLDQISVEAIVTRLITENLEISGGFGLLRAREETALGVRQYTLLTAPLTATYDMRDNRADARNGYYINVAATPFVSLAGDKNGARLYADARAYRSFGDRFGLAARGQVGSVIGTTLDLAPADYVFFSGGSNTVRGQSYKSLGIDSVVNGETITQGGLSFVGAQVEARYGVTPDIGLVGFYDVGYVGASETPGTEGEWNTGTGLGLRYNTGIGPIRLDIATPANGARRYDRVEVYIGIGQSF